MPSSGFTITSFPQTQAALNANSTYSNYYADSSGTANTVTVSTGTGIVFTFIAGQMLQIKVANSNTGAATLSVNGTSANLVLPIGAAQLAGGELQAGGIYTVLYDGTNWQLIGAVAYPPTPAELAATVSVPFPTFPPGDIRRYGASSTQTAANNVTYIQAALNANAGYGPVIVPGGTYTLDSRITAPANTTLVLQNGATLSWSATLGNGSHFPASQSTPATPGLEVMGSSFALSGSGSIVGPFTGGSANGAQIGIFSQGGSLSGAYSGFYIGPGIEISGWAGQGVTTQFVNDVRIIGCKLYNCGYAGFLNVCGIQSVVHWNEVYGISPGISGNCYGISHTTDSLAFSGAGRGDSTPMCFAADVAFNYIHDITLWSGIAFAGGYDSRIHHNAIYNCCQGINATYAPTIRNGVTTGTYGGENFTIDNNIVTLYERDSDSTTGVTGLPLGIVANGGANVYVNGITVDHNVIVGYGNSAGPPTAYAMQCVYALNATLQGNSLRGWQGYGLYLAYMDGQVRGNHFDALGSSMAGSACIYAATNVTADITGNKHRIPSGTAAQYGAYVNNSADPRYLLADNDFDSASVSPYGQAGGQLQATQMRGQSDLAPTIAVTGSPSTISVSAAGFAPQVRVSLGNSAAVTISGISGSWVGQVIVLHAATTNAVTISDGTSFKLSGGTWASGQYYTLTLLCLAASGIQFVELGRSANT